MAACVLVGISWLDLHVYFSALPENFMVDPASIASARLFDLCHDSTSCIIKQSGANLKPVYADFFHNVDAACLSLQAEQLWHAWSVTCMQTHGEEAV